MDLVFILEVRLQNTRAVTIVAARLLLVELICIPYAYVMIKDHQEIWQARLCIKQCRYRNKDIFRFRYQAEFGSYVVNNPLSIS